MTFPIYYKKCGVVCSLKICNGCENIKGISRAQTINCSLKKTIHYLLQHCNKMNSVSLVLLIFATIIYGVLSAPTPSSSSSSKPPSLPEQIYSLANSSLRNSSHFPGGGLWDAALLNTNSTAHSQLGFFCEKIAMFEVLSTLQESSSVFNVKRRDIVWDNNHVAIALESACHLWNCPVNPDVECIRNKNTCHDFKEFLNKMRLYCPKVLLKKIFSCN